jgi:hypothetical protein
LVEALRETAARLSRQETVYRWSQLAHCNCGHLAQTITGLSPGAIREAAGRHRGDWAEQARTIAMPQRMPERLYEPDYGSRPAIDEGAWEPEDLGRCPVAELEMTQIFAELGAWGLSPSDIAALERLDDPEVRRRLGTNTVDFLQSDRQNVMAYLLAWADLLEERIARASVSAQQGGEATETRELGFDPGNDGALGWPDLTTELPIAAE